MFCNANGDVLLSVYILKASYGRNRRSEDGHDDVFCDKLVDVEVEMMASDDRSTRQHRTWPRYYAWTEPGYNNTVLHEKIIHKFYEEWSRHNSGREVILLGDKLAAHVNVDLIEDMMAKRVYLFMLPKNCSHFCQPLDSIFLGLFR